MNVMLCNREGKLRHCWVDLSLLSKLPFLTNAYFFINFINFTQMTELVFE